MAKNNQKLTSSLIFFLLILVILATVLPVGAKDKLLAPDRVQQVLDLLALECQNLSDYAAMALYGDVSRFNDVAKRFSVSVENVGMLLNGFDKDSLESLRSISKNFSSDAASAQSAAAGCTQIRGVLYSKTKSLLEKQYPQNFNECQNDGYRVSDGICFIGGSPVYDEDGYLTGFYYTDCFDNGAYFQGSCWYCFYGADKDGCIDKK